MLLKKIIIDAGKLVLDMKIISENSYKANINSLLKTTKEIKKNRNHSRKKYNVKNERRRI